ncbi:2-oxoacid:acceptor oxidoreductase subunit alpha [Desulfuromonas sp. AOP6]|uniref:2-oxoacid:acceptor oxidoreductase subunit alpha n=1 Tax=Desulfuromonas sp. AOP6 TaxID=1566351 RepID=UPI00128328AD|nr:2-oxoacid:acceptor oxidoreductase subunit alpha [Desulfuromonas sp. AOP6]BCA78254.1 2-oxoacid:ferredoxin oxidoreductase subunit alpha [Desulfuromonas sp. AOP6]
MQPQTRFKNEISIVLAGEAGQGIQTIETVLTRTLKAAGLHVFATKEFMSRIRGGSNSTTIRAASSPVRAYAEEIDLCVLLDGDAYSWIQERITPDTLVIGDPAVYDHLDELIPLPLADLAKQVGEKIYANAVACGFVIGLLGLKSALLEKTLEELFGGNQEVLDKNLRASRLGLEQGEATAKEKEWFCDLQTNPQIAGQLFLNGSEAVGLGALTGGCNFIASYPMSPSTGVLQFLAKYAERFGLVVEQAEDEISAINMGLGSWYAGGRAMVSTSGGGFALMGEGLSLAGGIESPMVIHLAQRPGPATGLPTRTEQGDLDLALYAGHGEFPRMILAPGTLEEAFECARLAFDLADASQSPVFILTDQYLLDSSYNVPELPLPAEPDEHHIVETSADYRRYALTESGLSPRGIPGYGQGLVCVDSDEHDEAGFITEDAEVRAAMVDKRLRKFKGLRSEQTVKHHLFGPTDYRRLLVGWGSTRLAIEEALARVGDPETAFLYSPQVYPLSEQVQEHLQGAQSLIVIENNATGQFARLIQRETGRQADACWLQYNGRPFSVEALEHRLRQEVTS